MWQCLYPQDCILTWIYGPQINYNYWFQAFAVFRMLFVFFWVIPRRLIYIYIYVDVSEQSICSIFTPAFEDGTDRVFRNVGIYKSDAGESPKRKQTTNYNYNYRMTNLATILQTGDDRMFGRLFYRTVPWTSKAQNMHQFAY